jgi:signal transduction histidine kinase
LWDALLASALLVVSASIVLTLDDSAPRRALGLVVASAHVLALVERRRHPVEVLSWMAATGMVFVALGFPVVGLGPAALVAVYSIGAYRPRAVSLPVLVAASAVMAVSVVASGSSLDTVVGNVAVFGAAWFVGDVSRRGWDRAAELARTRDELARQAVVQERLHIARELHDIVAHALSVIAVQSGTGRMVVDRSPHLAADALGAIEETSRTALQDMRRLLDVLRSDESSASRSPNPGLAGLDELAAVTAATGPAVEVDVQGERRPLSAGADAAAYRILQEALTNVRKHAEARRVWISVRYRTEGVELEVADDGRGSTDPVAGSRPGHGLIGMQERATLYAGRLTAGNRPEGGFVVRAWICDHVSDRAGEHLTDGSVR